MNRENQYDIHRYEEIEIPEALNDAVKKGLAMGNQICRKRQRRKTTIKWVSVAAAVAAVCVVVVSNPVLAARIPILGHVFERIQGNYSYQGDYSAVATPLQEETEGAAGGENGKAQSPAYTKESNGVTVSLSEVYCNDQAIYLAMTIENEEGFPDTLVNQDGNVVMQLETKEKYSFHPSEQQALRSVEGKLLDQNTFAGILRISLDEINVDDSKWIEAVEEEEYKTDQKAFEKLQEEGDMDDLLVKIQVPKSFTMELSISQIIGSKAEQETIDLGKTEAELAAMSDEEWEQFMKEEMPADYYDFPCRYCDYWYDGAWDYEIPMSMDSSRTQIKEVGTTNEDGVGIASVEKTPFELRLNEIYPDEGYDYFPVALDAKGEILPSGLACNVNVYAIHDRDVSTVYVYICDYDEYMDELKGYYYSDDYEEKKAEKSFQELLEERAVYQTEVQFD